MIATIITSTCENDNYDLLMPILDVYEYETIKKFTSIVINNNEQRLLEVLEESKNKSTTTFSNLLISICTHIYTNIDCLNLFSAYIEQNENVISLISDK